VFAFRQSIGRALDIGERLLCGTPVISRSRLFPAVRCDEMSGGKVRKAEVQDRGRRSAP